MPCRGASRGCTDNHARRREEAGPCGLASGWRDQGRVPGCAIGKRVESLVMQILQILGRTTRQGPRRAYARALGGASWDLASFQSKGPPQSGANPPHLLISCDDAGHRRSGSPTDLHGLGLQRAHMRMRLGLLRMGLSVIRDGPATTTTITF